ncbi:MAG: flagellar basal body L-ring protein FlgH [Phycisphaerae bacterium]|nr:flagellar basal body L-ring protein FlgH [Phycisphaerae bacterium]
MTRIGLLLVLVVTIAWASTSAAQTTSLRKRHATTQPADARTRESTKYEGNKTIETNSLIAVPVLPPKGFQMHDLVTIIVRHQRSFESDADLESKKKYEIQSELDAFLKFAEGGWGAANFRRGKPNVDYKFDSKVTNEAGTSRDDRLTTRITAEIIDVKPNGTIVLQARNEVKFEEESSVMTLTGICRKEDVTPDNSVLSTQLADLRIDVQNTGAVRDGSRRGWLTTLLDILRPV